MSTPVIRVNHPSDTVNGGMILDGDNTVIVNGHAIAVHGSHVAPHAPFTGAHNSAVMQAHISTTVFVGGKRVIVSGNAASCGHFVSGGSPNVVAG